MPEKELPKPHYLWLFSTLNNEMAIWDPVLSGMRTNYKMIDFISES